MNRWPNPWTPSLLSVMGLVLLAGCASPQGIEPASGRLREVATLAPEAVPAADVAPLATRWWQALGDSQLDSLVERALAGHPSLRMAQARLAKAMAQVEAADANPRPQVTGSLDMTRQRYTEKGMIPKPLAGSVQDTGTLQLGASWELDFFHKHQSALAAALGTARATRADADAASVLLSSNVVRAYLQLARLQDLLALAQRTQAQREHTLRLVQDRLAAGLDTQQELRQSEAAVPEARQQVEALREQEQLTRNALAALVGQPGKDPVSQPPRLAGLRPLTTPWALPADLLGRRADVAAARWRVEAAGSEVDHARAQFYPNINLVGFAGLSSIGLEHLLDRGALQWGVGPAIRLPVFDAGRLRANLRGRTADLDAAIEAYNHTVIEAVHEVADQLASGRSIARQQLEQQQAQQGAEAAYQIAQQRYQEGLGNYLQVLSAETQVLAQRRLGVDLRARALDAQVGLARALGGGWQAEPDLIPSAPAGVAAARP